MGQLDAEGDQFGCYPDRLVCPDVDIAGAVVHHEVILLIQTETVVAVADVFTVHFRQCLQFPFHFLACSSQHGEDRVYSKTSAF